MTWRDAVNGVPQTLTGYEPRRVRTASPLREPPARASGSVSAPAPAPAPAIRFPEDYDDEARELITAVKPCTMTSPERLNALTLAVRQVIRHDELFARLARRSGVETPAPVVYERACADLLVLLEDGGRVLPGDHFDFYRHIAACPRRNRPRGAELPAGLVAYAAHLALRGEKRHFAPTRRVRAEQLRSAGFSRTVRADTFLCQLQFHQAPQLPFPGSVLHQ